MAGFHSPAAFWIGGAATEFQSATTGQLLIAGVDRTAWLRADSCEFRRQFNRRSTLTCILEDLSRGYIPVLGSSMHVLLGETRMFGGLITSVRAYRHPTTDYMQYEIEATDYNVIADKRIIRYDGLIGVLSLGPGYAGDIIRSLVRYALEGENVGLDDVEQGPYLPDPITFYFETFTAGMNKICQLAPGYRWRINEYKQLEFSDYAAVPAPFSITATSGNWRDLFVTSSLDVYRNRQHARTESVVASTMTETFTGDGTTRDFFIGFVNPPSLNPTRWFTGAPAITLDGVPLTAGRLGFDGIGEGLDCTYDKDGIGIHFISAAGQSVPGVGAVLSVTYDYSVGSVVTVSDAAEIAARAAVEGGSGIWENVDEQRNIANGNTLEAIASGDIDLYGTPSIRVEYTTDEQGLSPGQQQPCTLAAWGVPSTDLLIESIRTIWIAGAEFEFEHVVGCTNIGPMATPQQLIEKLAETARIGVPRSDPVRTDIAGDVEVRAMAGRSSDGSSGNHMDVGAPAIVGEILASNNGPFTVAMWIRVDDLAQTGADIFHAAGVYGRKWWIDFTAGSVSFGASSYSGSNPATGSGMTISDGQWHHVVYRKSAAGASAWDGFIDGAKTTINASINFTLGTFLFYVRVFGNIGTEFKGAVAEIAVWTTAVTDDEIADMAGGVHANAAHPANLKQYWPVYGNVSPETNDGLDSQDEPLVITGACLPA